MRVELTMVTREKIKSFDYYNMITVTNEYNYKFIL